MPGFFYAFGYLKIICTLSFLKIPPLHSPMKIIYSASLLTIFFILFTTVDSLSQQILYDYKSKGGLKDFNALPIGDSILFSCEEFVANTWIRKSKWITDTQISGFNLPTDAFAAATFGNEIYLYSLDGKPKSRVLKAVSLNPNTKVNQESNIALPLTGTLVGNYIDKNLFLLLLQDHGRSLRVVEIHKMNIVNEIHFKLPISLSYHLWREFSGDLFFKPTALNSFKGNSKVKIFKSDKFYITLDQRDPSSQWNTLVLTLDTFTQTVTSSEFKTKTNAVFSSFILDDKLFRVLNDKKRFIVEIYSLRSGTLVSQSEVGAHDEDFPIYFRYGRKNEINADERFSSMQRFAGHSEASLVVHKVAGTYFIQWGTYFNDNGMTAGGIYPVGMMNMLVGSVILHLMEGPGVNRYFYYEWTEPDNMFRVREQKVELIREKIDAYEIAKNEAGITYKHKSYMEYKAGIIGIYYDNKKNLSIVHFE